MLKGSRVVSCKRRVILAVLDTPQKVSSSERVRPRKKGPTPVLHTEGDMLEDTKQMVGIVWGAGLLAGVQFFLLCTKMTDPVTTAAIMLAASSGYVFADFVSGIYHWSLDNYGDINTPIFGFQIDAFQGHHKSPWTITRRGFYNNLSKPAIAGMPFFAALILCPLPAAVESFLFSVLVFAVLAQEFHKWSHSVHPPRLAEKLANGGLLISRKAHGKHHHDPFEGNYCIVSGICNDFLDRVGFFRKLEAFFYRLTGVAPICWNLDPSLRVEALGEEA